MTSYLNGDTAGSPTARRRPMSPEEIRRARPARTGLGRRGYHEPDVDDLLSRIAGDVDGWITENVNLRADNERLKNALREWQSQHGERRAEASASTQPNLEAVLLLSRAQQEADSMVAQAQDYARRLAMHAQQQYEAVLRSAQQQAHEEAERAVQDYRARAGSRYTAEVEELERRLAWVRTFLDTVKDVESQLTAARETLADEVKKWE